MATMRHLYDQNWQIVTVGSEVYFSPGWGEIYEGTIRAIAGGTIVVRTDSNGETTTLKNKGRRIRCAIDGSHYPSGVTPKRGELASFYDKITHRIIVKR